MAGRPRPRSSRTLRFGILAGFVAAALNWGVAFTVRGAWDGSIADVRNLPKSLGPEVVNGFAFGAKDGHFNVSVDDGHLNVNYDDGPISLSMNDENLWQANYSTDNTKLQVRGKGANDMNWDISKQSVIDGMGAVDVNVNSESGFGFSVEPELPKLPGVQLKAHAHSNGDGIHGRLEAQRQLAKNLALKYNVETTDGDWALQNLAHEARLDGEFGSENKAVVILTRDPDETLGYNATLTRDLSGIAGHESALTLGADDYGVYGKVGLNPELGKGLRASYHLAGRADYEEDPEFAQSVKLSHDLGTLKLSHGSDKDILAEFESDVARGPNRAYTKVGYTVGDDIPTFNVSLSRDLADALDKLSAEGEVQIGIDDMSHDGLYGKLSATRKFGKGAAAKLSTGGRLNSLEHSLALSNNLGYAELVKSPADDVPRLRVGYKFDA